MKFRAVAQRIPISLLELNTFAHAICALLIYFLWWEKPFEVDYPTLLDGEIFRTLLGMQWMIKDQLSTSLRDDLQDFVESSEEFQDMAEVNILFTFPPQLMHNKLRLKESDVKDQ